MNLEMPKESIVFLAGILLSSLLIPLCLPLFKRLGIVDRPNARSTHTTAIPRGMGIVVVLNFVAIVYAYIELVPGFPMVEQGRLHAVLWAVGLLAAVGFVDDTKGVTAFVKLFFQCGCAAILTLANYSMPLPAWFGGYQELAQNLFTVVWIVGVINAVNFIDGSDGLATTLSALSMGLFVGISRILPAETLKFAEPVVRSINLLGLAGIACALPFLLFNLSPARCFLGDAGSTFFGLLLAVLGLLTAQLNEPSLTPGITREFAWSYFLVPWLVLCVPIFDGLRVSLGRVLRGKSPFRPDNRHLHHLLHRAGLSANQMVFLVSLGVLIFGLAAAILVRSNQSPFLLIGILVLLIYGLHWFLESSYRARRFVTLALNRRLLHFVDVTEGYEDPASFKERFEQELARAKRHGSSLTVVVVNTVTRKPAAAGASPLENPKFLESVLRAMRREDVKCRFSNERLAFLLVETPKEMANTVCGRLWQRFTQIRQGESADLQILLGRAAYPSDGQSVASLLQIAEAEALHGSDPPHFLGEVDRTGASTRQRPHPGTVQPASRIGDSSPAPVSQGEAPLPATGVAGPSPEAAPRGLRAGQGQLKALPGS